ncbi:MAG: DUF1385 domain-containing protein [Bryobacteraceae bacterium]
MIPAIYWGQELIPRVNTLKFLGLSMRAHLLPFMENGSETLVGGQAVIEGVMMRAPHSYCTAVRKPDGSIVTEEFPVKRPSEIYPMLRFAFIRGVGILGQAMWLGMKALRFSANASLDEGDPNAKKQEISGWAMALNLALSFAFFIFLYKFVPLYLATLLEKRFPALHGNIAFNLTDGIIRMAIFVGFLYSISLWKDIRRVFEYHGAEHKVVFNFESGKPLTVENAQTFRTFHPRCGTSFLLVVMLVAIVVYTLIPYQGFAAKFAWRVILLPVIMGVSYEVIRYAAKRRGSLMATITAPGLWLQRITTQQPSDEQTVVAIHALEGALKLEAEQGGELVIA